MSTALIIVIAILIGYIIYMIMGSSGTDIPTYEAPAKPAKASAKPARKARVARKPAKAVKPDEPDEEIVIRFKNPENGETAANPTNYRFAKRWIKDALVSEGFLDRIYKNSELSNPKISKKVRNALDRFKSMEKYIGD